RRCAVAARRSAVSAERRARLLLGFRQGRTRRSAMADPARALRCVRGRAGRARRAGPAAHRADLEQAVRGRTRWPRVRRSRHRARAAPARAARIRATRVPRNPRRTGAGTWRPAEPDQGFDPLRRHAASRDPRLRCRARTPRRAQSRRPAYVGTRTEARPVTQETAIVIGASSGLGRALAEQLARAKWPLLLVASDPRDLDAVAHDLHLRFDVAVRALALDLGREPDPGARVRAALDGLPPPGALLVAAGVAREYDDFTLAPAAVGQLLAINLHAPLVLVDALLPRLVETHATIVLIGSIAAARGRGRNVAYAAAKRGLESLYESLRQRYRPKELSVQLYRL